MGGLSGAAAIARAAAAAVAWRLCVRLSDLQDFGPEEGRRSVARRIKGRLAASDGHERGWMEVGKSGCHPPTVIIFVFARAAGKTGSSSVMPIPAIYGTVGVLHQGTHHCVPVQVALEMAAMTCFSSNNSPPAGCSLIAVLLSGNQGGQKHKKPAAAATIARSEQPKLGPGAAFCGTEFGDHLPSCRFRQTSGAEGSGPQAGPGGKMHRRRFQKYHGPRLVAPDLPPLLGDKELRRNPIIFPPSPQMEENIEVRGQRQRLSHSSSFSFSVSAAESYPAGLY